MKRRDFNSEPAEAGESRNSTAFKRHRPADEQFVLSPAKAGYEPIFLRDPRVTLASLAHPGLNSSACFAGLLSGDLFFV